MDNKINFAKISQLRKECFAELDKVRLQQSKTSFDFKSILKDGITKKQKENALDLKLKEYLEQLKFFDPLFYKYSAKELIEKQGDVRDHFWEIGNLQLRRPNLFFNSRYYYAAYADLAAAGVNPVFHYVTNGFDEGRRCHETFSVEHYLTHKYPKQEADLTQLMWDYHSGSLFDNPPVPYNIYPTDFKIAKMLNQLEVTADLTVPRSEIFFAEQGAPVVSVIIPVYNQLEFTLVCLKALAANPSKIPWEIIVIDDCSGCQTEKVISQIPGIKYVRNQENLGFLKSCNKAAEMAQGEYLVFLNNDTAPLPGWLDTLYQTFEHHPRAGLVGSKLIYPDGQLQEAGGLIWRDGSGTNCGKFQCADHPDYNYVRPVDYCSGAAIMISNALWQQLGGFDLRFVPAYYEDVDLAFAVRKAGYDVLYQPHSEIIHFEGVSSGTDLTQGAKKYQLVNQKKFCEKWHNELEQHSAVINHQALYSQKRRTKTLVIDQQVPTPDKDAGSVYCINFLKILAENHQVDFLNSHGCRYEEQYTKDLQALGVRHLYGSWFGGHNFENMDLDWEGLELVVLFRHNVANQFIDRIKLLAPQARIILVTVDLHFVREEQEARLLESKKLKLSAKRTKGEELAAMIKSDLTVVLGNREIAIVKEYLPQVVCHQLPIWQKIYHPQTPFSQRKNIFFLGGFNHPPNADALTYFLEEIWPDVSSRLPDVSFYIYGNTIPKHFEKYANERVIIGGYVPDLSVIFETFRINIAPLRYGAGQNGKVISSLCHGLPTVISPIAAEGIGLTHNQEALIGANSEDFANELVRLYNDQTLWEGLSANSLKFAETNLSEQMAKRVIDLMLSELDS